MHKKILLLCYGNPGRLDDGLGPAFAAEVEKRRPACVTVSSDYQLTVEDACTIAEHDLVLFVDASVSAAAPYCLEPAEPAPEPAFSSHLLDPGHLLYLAERLFGAQPEAYCLGIRGYEFDDFGERLSAGAERNLEAGLAFFYELVDGRAPGQASGNTL